MRNRIFIGLALSTAGWLWASPALPCGGGFGMGLQVGSTQNIVVAYKAGVETYQFSPYFCGQSAQFGFVLPVPQSLSATPTLGATAVVGDLQIIAAPTIQYVCPGDGGDASVGHGGSAPSGADAGNSRSVQVIDKGQVGIFDYSVIKADTASAFTDWLNANHYPYTSESSAQFTYYVSEGWYFVAFKVTADSQDPPSGTQLCGNLGPIQLAFPASVPVIPARIAAASSGGGDAGTAGSSSYTNYLDWTVFYVGPKEVSLSMGDAGAYVPTASLLFSGQVSADEVAAHPAGGIVAAGDWFTELSVIFEPALLASDLTFQPNSTNVAYRQVVYGYSSAACSEPVGSEPVGSEPVGSEPVGSEPVGSEPVGSEPVGSEPVGSEPVGSEPVGAEGVAWIPAEAGISEIDASVASYDASNPLPRVDANATQSAEAPAQASGSSCSLSPAGASSSPGLPLGLGAMLGMVVISARRRGRSRVQ